MTIIRAARQTAVLAKGTAVFLHIFRNSATRRVARAAASPRGGPLLFAMLARGLRRLPPEKIYLPYIYAQKLSGYIAQACALRSASIDSTKRSNSLVRNGFILNMVNISGLRRDSSSKASS